MRRVLGLVLVMCGACSGDDAPADESVTLSIASPAPGAQFERVTLDDVGALVAAVPMQLEVTGAPARVAIVFAGAEVDALPDGTATAILDAPGAATLVATAYDADGAALASAEVAIEIVEPAVASCHEWLDLFGIEYTVGPASRGIVDPVTAKMPINGVAFRSGSGLRSMMLGDCSLIRSLALAAPHWRKRGIVEVTDMGVYNYRCINNSGTPPNCTIGLSEHSFGNAIDLASFKDANGETYVVNDDWVIDPDDRTCTAPTEDGKDTFLHDMICDIKEAKIWNIVLTPNYNSLHRNHFHVDLTEGSDFITRTAIDEGDHGHAHTNDH